MPSCLLNEIKTFPRGFVCQRVCVCARARAYLNMQRCRQTCGAPLFWFLLKTVTGPRCRINDCDKRATPSGTLVHNPFPKYLFAGTWCMARSLEVYCISSAGRKWEGGKAVLAGCFFLARYFLLTCLISLSEPAIFAPRSVFIRLTRKPAQTVFPVQRDH